MWANDICHVTHLQQPPLRATVECHIAHRQRQAPMPHHATKAPASECHVMKTEGARKAEAGVGGGGGKEAKGETAGEECVCAPSLLQRCFRSQRDGVHPTHRLVRPSRRDRGGVHPTHRLVRPSRYQRGGGAFHTPSRSTLQTQTRQCASHTLSGLAFQTRTNGVHPTHHSVQAFLAPLSFGGGISPATARMRWREIHMPPRSSWIIPPNGGGNLY